MRTSPRERQSSIVSGISLIEVLVVIVLLLVGILSVVRLFPPGFLVNKQSEAATLAARLAQQEIDRYTNNSANLMSAIVPIVPVAANNSLGYAFQVDTNSTPDDLSAGKPGIANVDPYYYSDVNKIRRIIGEFVRIPIPSPTAAGKGSIYVLSAGPIYNIPWDGQTESVFVSGAPLFRMVVDSTAFSSPQDLRLRPQQYGIDYSAAQVAFWTQPTDANYPNHTRQFLATFSYYDTNNQVKTVVDQVVPDTGAFPNGLPDGYSGWLPLKLPADARTSDALVQDSDVISRKFVRNPPVNGAYQWNPGDPYQFDVLSQNDGSFANVGVLVFNPLGHDYQENTPGGVQPLSARIDYDVLDWRIIREDRPMPAVGPFQVRLSLKDIKQLNDLDDDQTPYIGIFRDSTVPAVQRYDMLIYDLGSGTAVPQFDSLGNRNYTVDYKQGVVTFSDAYGSQYPSGNFRFFYKAHGDWALQVQKAPSTYMSVGIANVGFGQYYTPIQTTDPGSPTRMYFALMDAGKTVGLRSLWYKDTGGVSHHITNHSFRLEDRPAFFETINGRAYTYLDLKSIDPNAASWDPVPMGIPASGVQGVSFKSRVLWTNGQTVSTTSVGNVVHVRWRKIDLDTFLTRTSS